MATISEQLASMRLLQENWDGYGAAPPHADVLDLAQRLTEFLETLFERSSAGASRLQVNPTRIGGVLIEWDDPSTQHEIELNPDGTIGFLHLTKATGHIETRTSLGVV